MNEVEFKLNGSPVIVEARPGTTLLDLLKHQLGAVSVKRGCETGECGACTVLLDGRAVKSCTVLAVQADGRSLTTVEGLAQGDQLHAIQEGFWEEHGLQCGYCTPGMIMCAHDLLERSASPSEREIREALDGNLCRCTGYQHIVNSVQAAARKLAKRKPTRAVAAD